MSIATQPQSVPEDQMPVALVGTPYKNEEGAFEYPFPNPPLPTPPYQPTSMSPTSSIVHAVMASAGSSRPDSPASKLASRMVKDGPVPPGLAKKGSNP